MGPVLAEGEVNPRPAPVVDYKAAAARGDRVPRMVKALESKLKASDPSSEFVNGVKHKGEKAQAENKVVHTNGTARDENGSLDQSKQNKPPSEPVADVKTDVKRTAVVPEPQAQDGWEPAEAPGSHKQEAPSGHRQESAAKGKVTEIGKKDAEKKPPILPAPPRAAPQPALVEAASTLSRPVVASAAKEKTDKQTADEPREEGAAPDVAAASTDQVQQEEKPTRTFCLVRIPRPDGSIGGAAIREAENRMKDKREKQEFLTVAVRLRQISRNEANGKVKEALETLKAVRAEIKSRVDLVKPMWETQRKLQEAGKLANSKRRDLPCATEAELDQKIQQLEYTRQHESQSLTEEKRILREIRQLESSREQVKANSALLSQYSSSGAERESISTQLKPLQEELETLRAEESEAKKALDLVDAEQKELNKGVEELLAQREEAREEHRAAYEELKKLRQQAAQRDHDYYQNRRDIQKFKQLAAQRDIPALEEFAHTQVEGIMARFSTDAAYRATYVKNNEISTLRRFGSLDTRSPGVDEDPAPLSPTAERGAGKASLKEKDDTPAKAKSALAPAKGAETLSSKAEVKAKAPAEAKPRAADAKPKVAAEAKPKAAAPPAQEAVVKSSKAAAVEPVRAPPVDKEAAAAAEAAAKEKRREEEVRKAKEAEERKRKAAEKKAAKAEQRRKREAEEATKKKDKKKQTATPPSEAADSDAIAAAVPEPDSAAPSTGALDAKPTAAVEEGARRRKQPAVEKKKLKKVLGRNKKFSLQSWLEANVTTVAIVALIVSVLIAAYFYVKSTGGTSSKV
ncbi:hypothetical protein KFL_001290180 [Klebsormidium nitens]|uniref:Proton pump-interactor 1 n=1 Tax=Klebsormidium nitens TaxID=105231 RepID=A0A1Y1I2F0_KLENI|nr:hypothetical protein KFL_001290180 [Klebsormidium nitens]|eukprot:GAQ82927.1 hypothetical protein KFL_001290180 [Klebsormidium nitens]